jgi:hypothetical protein
VHKHKVCFCFCFCLCFVLLCDQNAHPLCMLLLLLQWLQLPILRQYHHHHWHLSSVGFGYWPTEQASKESWEQRAQKIFLLARPTVKKETLESCFLHFLKCTVNGHLYSALLPPFPSMVSTIYHRETWHLKLMGWRHNPRSLVEM